MDIDLTLLSTNASGPLVPSRLAQALVQLAKIPGAARAPIGTMRGQELRLALVLPLDDDASAAFMLDFPGQGARVRGKAHGPSAVLLAWALHAVAALLKCTLQDAGTGKTIEATPADHREAALEYLSAYEADVRASRKAPSENEGADFLAWLAREEHLALSDESDEVAALGAELPMSDAPALYEMLLESDAVEDVFVSERELAAILARFRARRAS